MNKLEEKAREYCYNKFPMFNEKHNKMHIHMADFAESVNKGLLQSKVIDGELKDEPLGKCLLGGTVCFCKEMQVYGCQKEQESYKAATTLEQLIKEHGELKQKIMNQKGMLESYSLCYDIDQASLKQSQSQLEQKTKEVEEIERCIKGRRSPENKLTRIEYLLTNTRKG